VLILLLLALLLTPPLTIFSDSFDDRPALERTLNIFFEGGGVGGRI
jgi:hypothetical protein